MRAHGSWSERIKIDCDCERLMVRAHCPRLTILWSLSSPQSPLLCYVINCKGVEEGKRKRAGTLERSEVSTIFLAFLWLRVIPRIPWSHHPPCTQFWLFIYFFFMRLNLFCICRDNMQTIGAFTSQILPPNKSTKSLVIPNRPKWSADEYQWSAIIPDMKLKFLLFGRLVIDWIQSPLSQRKWCRLKFWVFSTYR